MSNFTFSDVIEMIATSPESILVLHYESTHDSTMYTPAQLLAEVKDQAEKKVKDGEYESFDEALAYIESISYIMTKEEYDAEQEQEIETVLMILNLKRGLK